MKLDKIVYFVAIILSGSFLFASQVFAQQGVETGLRPGEDGLQYFDSGQNDYFFDSTQQEELKAREDANNNFFNSGLRSIQGGGLDPGGQIIPSQGQYANPFLWVMRSIMTLLTLVGMGTIAGIIYGGFLWMTSGGETGRVDKAKMTLRNSVIGLVIILSSYSITYFIVTQVTDTTAAFGGGLFFFN